MTFIHLSVGVVIITIVMYFIGFILAVCDTDESLFFSFMLSSIFLGIIITYLLFHNGVL